MKISIVFVSVVMACWALPPKTGYKVISRCQNDCA